MGRPRDIGNLKFHDSIIKHAITLVNESERNQDIFKSVYFDNKPYASIARELNLSSTRIPAIYCRIYRKVRDKAEFIIREHEYQKAKADYDMKQLYIRSIRH